MAQSDPPGRVGRLNLAEGPVIFSAAGDNEWTDAVLNRPLTRADRIWTDRGSRAELQVGSSAVRLDSQSRLEILALDDQSAQLSLTQGSIYVRIRSLPEGENFEIDTPNLAYRAAYPGDYRIDVDATGGTTRVTIHSGTGAVYGEGGQVLPLGGGQQVTFRARTLAQVNAQESPPQDAFDRWAADRNRREDQSVAARYVPREVVGYQQLDAHGQWSQDATHGPVWIPQGLPANWAPYRQGHWEWISPWGWTWIDAAPWGFAPFHYGRWTLIASRWAWVPGRIGLRPVYAPALVAFVGGSSGGINWSTALGGGRPGVAWFPLAPGEAWQPGYRASPVYMSNVNRNIAVQPNASYAHQRRPEALTAISAEDFHRGQPVRGNWMRVAANTLSNAQVVPPPPMPERSERQHATPVRPAPPQPEIRQVAASAPLPRRDEAAERAQRDREAQAQAAQQAQAQALAAQKAQALAAAQAQAQQQAAEQQRVQREQVARAEKAKLEEQARRDEQLRREQQAKTTAQATAAAEQERRAAQAKADAEARREQLARREQARRELQAQRAEQAKREKLAERAEQMKREQVAKRAELSKREQLARRDEARREQLAKRELLAKQVEQSRRDAQGKRAEKAKREALARREEQVRREAAAALAKREEQQRRQAHVEQARRAADRDAQVLREQRTQREEQARKEAQEREIAQREALQRQQQALTEQLRREQQNWEQQQRVRQRPNLRDDIRPASPEIWQRSIPIVSPPGRTS